MTAFVGYDYCRAPFDHLRLTEARIEVADENFTARRNVWKGHVVKKKPPKFGGLDLTPGLA